MPTHSYIGEFQIFRSTPSLFQLEALASSDSMVNEYTKKAVILNNQERDRSQMLSDAYQNEKIILMCCPMQIFL